jgi:hypothetical protein
MKSMLWLAAFGAIALLGATMQPSGQWGPDCGYSTIEQCRATALGVGFCYQNPAFTAATQGTPKRQRR